MTTTSPADVMETLFERVWNHGELAQIEQIFAKPDSARQFISAFRAAFPDLHHTIEESIVDGARIVVRWRAAGTHRSPWEGRAAIGRVVTFSGITIALVEQGQIARHHTEWDRAGLMEQLGGGQSA
ncbi:ester cyclase [Candidatus Gracilibacteria bacterium]|nr:ester cyclase [Candidatus Gracilibacteria bacterium]